MIYFRTCAYNAEKTLGRAIESILNQSYKEFTYYILDNGSTDRTSEIVRRYAEADKRIVSFYNVRNHDKSENPDFWSLPNNLCEGDYFCTLDADDTYDVCFLEVMLKFMTENGLDMVACGSGFIDAATGMDCGERVLHRDYILHGGEAFDRYFPEIHWNLRQSWGKLYSAKAARRRIELNAPEWFPKAYGGDTASVYECVKASEGVGVCAKVMHHYYVSPKSVSYKWIEGRERADLILFDKAVELLENKCGHVSPQNLSFLYAVQFNALKDTLNVLHGAELPPERKIAILKDIVENKITKNTFTDRQNASQEEKTELLTWLACWIIELAQNVDESVFADMISIFTCFNANFGQMISADSFKWFVKKLPVLVRNVALGEYEHGVNNLIVYLAREREAELAVDYPFVLGQVLASLRNEEAKYVYFSKQLIGWCIENNQSERARQDLEEWLQILPEDKDLIELSQKC